MKQPALRRQHRTDTSIITSILATRLYTRLHTIHWDVVLLLPLPRVQAALVPAARLVIGSEVDLSEVRISFLPIFLPCIPFLLLSRLRAFDLLQAKPIICVYYLIFDHCIFSLYIRVPLHYLLIIGSHCI